MANQEHLEILKQGPEVWNQWRQEYPTAIQPDFSKATLCDADLYRADLSKANLVEANLTRAFLSHANLTEANLSGADLTGAGLLEATLWRTTLSDAYLGGATLSDAYLSDADLRRANLFKSNLRGANLTKANLTEANLSGANLTKANLTEANLSNVDLTEANLTGADLTLTDLSGANLRRALLYRAVLVRTNLTRATLTRCSIYGISAWSVELEGARQDSLVITPPDEPTITVDNLKVAQFIYLLLNNKEVRDMINTITTKVVLILGRFTEKRKKVLDALRNELRKRNYLPIVFDFDKPASRDLTETISTLAHMARFIIADITDARSIPQELQAIVPNLPSVPVQPLLQIRAKEYGMFEHFRSYPWVLETYRYTTVDMLLKTLNERIIEPAERKAQKLEKR